MKELNRTEFVVVRNNYGIPNVSLERKIAADGETTDTFILSVVSNRLFLDLEHELDHIDQIFTRFLSQGVPFFTSVHEESQRGWRENYSYPGVLRSWQNTIAEYHVRLLEFKRLHQRQIDQTILRDHAQQVIIWSNKYFDATGLGKSTSKKTWELRHFPDLIELRNEVNELFLSTGFVFAEWEIAKNQYIELKPS